MSKNKGVVSTNPDYNGKLLGSPGICRECLKTCTSMIRGNNVDPLPPVSGPKKVS